MKSLLAKHAGLVAVIGAAVLTLAGLAVYSNSFRVPFIYDDESTVARNPRIRSLWSSGDPLASLEPTSEWGRPTVRLSLAVNYAINGLEPWGYHVMNLVIHILSSWVLFGVVRRTLRQGNLSERFSRAAPVLALAVAAIWLVHPLQTEAVTYITQRTELLAGFFYLLTLYASIRAWQSSRSWLWYGLGVGACVLGMGSKEVMVSAPIIVMLYDRTFVCASFRETFRRRWGFYAALAASWLVLAALVAGGPRSNTVGFNLGLSWWRYLLTQLGVIVNYLKLAFWPASLCLDYGRSDVTSLARAAGGANAAGLWGRWADIKAIAVAVAPGALVVGGLGAATVWGLFRAPAVGFLGAWFFLILAPSSSVVPIITEVAAERRMYLPLAAVIALVVVGGYALIEPLLRPPASSRGRLVAASLAMVAVAIVVTALGARAVLRNDDYRDDLTIWEVTVRQQPDNAAAQNNLGWALAQRQRYAEARQHFLAATRLPHCTHDVYYNLANSLSDLALTTAQPALYDEAIARYRQVIGFEPNDAAPHRGLGLALERKGDLDDAIAEYRIAMKMNARDPDTYDNLAMALAKKGLLREARAYLIEGLRIAPSHRQLQDNRRQVEMVMQQNGLPLQ